MPERDNPGDQPSRWSRLGVAAQIATIIGVPIGVIGIVVGVLALQSSNNASESSSATPAATISTTGDGSPHDEPTPTPTESPKSAWVRDQGRLCQRLNREASANTSASSGDLTGQLPTLRAASNIVGEFIADSAELEAPESDRDQVQTMLGHWSDATAYMTGMIRSAEQGDGSSFDQRLDQFNASMERGMRIARDLGAKQCS